MSEKRPKKAQKAPKCAPCAPAPRNQERAVPWATWLKNEFGGYLVHSANPHFLWFPSLRIAQQRHVDPRTSGHLVQPEGRPAHAQWGTTVGPPGVPRAKKRFFPKLFLDHLGCLNKCFWAVLSPWWRVLGHGKSHNALKMGRFGTNNGSKMGQRRIFPKMILDHLGCSDKWF